MVIFGICLVAVIPIVLIYLVNNRHFSIIKLGFALIAAPAVFICLTNLNDGYLYKKLFWTPTRLEMGHEWSDALIPFPIPQDNGTIRLMTPFELGRDDEGNIILSSDQIMNFKKLGSIEEPSYSFLFLTRKRSGSIKIDNGPNDGKIIEIRLLSITRLHFDYIGKYEIYDKKLKLLSANCNLLNLDREIFSILVLMLSFLSGLVLILIATIRKIWPPPQKHSFLESPFDAQQ